MNQPGQQAGSARNAGAPADILASLGPLGTRGKIWAWILFVVAIWGLVCWGYQVHYGLAVTAMSDYFTR